MIEFEDPSIKKVIFVPNGKEKARIIDATNKISDILQELPIEEQATVVNCMCHYLENVHNIKTGAEFVKLIQKEEHRHS